MTEVSNLSAIAKPLASEKLEKKLLRLTKKATKDQLVRRGIKEVVKAARKNEKGLCIIAGDISPIDVISHLPVLCEDQNIGYIYVNSKEALGAASATKRPTSCVLVREPTNDKQEWSELYEKCKAAIEQESEFLV